MLFRTVEFKKSKPKTKINLEKLRDENVKCVLESKINQRINDIFQILYKYMLKQKILFKLNYNKFHIKIN